jgi:hypothetical protein
MSLPILEHIRNICVRFFSDKVIYTIPKYLPYEKRIIPVFEVVDYCDRIEIVAKLTPPYLPPHQ